ncbi:MAG TPA: hypothetical protein VHX42_00770 [Candidatus Babeliales bacterium]|jgi:hypothetical protein|nr:hypothetical protein [Candidatus Babeliales bacterium]
MKKRTFQEYLKIRFNEDEIAEIKEQALREKNALEALQSGVASAERLEAGFKKICLRVK